MSFSFRNIFSPDESEADPTAGNGFPGGFTTPPGSVPEERGNLGGLPKNEFQGKRQKLIAGELLPLIPPAIVAQSGIPMEKELEIPLADDGSLDVKLSTLYRLCPELFAAEITPLNDSTITLPLRIGATSEVALKPGLLGNAVKGEEKPGGFWSPLGAGLQSSSGTGGVKDKPFSAPPIDKAISSGPSPSGNVFGGVPEVDVPPSGSGFQMPGGFETAPAMGGATKGANAFGHGPASAPSTPPALPDSPGGFFGFEAPPQAKDESGDREAHVPSNPFESDQGFATLFSKQAEKDASIPHPHGGGASGGGAAKAEPEGVWGAMFRGEIKEEQIDESVPFANIGKLLEEGVVQEKREPEPIRDSETAVFEPVFGFAPPEMGPEVEKAPTGFSGSSVPSVPVLPTEPQKSDAAERAFASGFESFASAPVESREKEVSPTEERPTEVNWSFDMPTISAESVAPSPPEPMVPEPSKAEAVEPSKAEAVEETPASDETPSGEPSSGFAPAGFEAPAPPIENKPDEAFAAEPAKQAMQPAAEMKAEEPVPAPVAVPEPATPVRQAPEPEVTLPVPAPAQAIEETSPVSEPVPVVQPQSQPEPVTESGEGTDLRDLEFRAIFSTSETFTLSMLARKIVSLPGIASCSLSTPGKLVQASRREENRLGNQAREMVETLRSLAKLTGLPEAKTFTLQTDRGIVSLFLEGDHCVCVNQEGPAFEAGVREKLILISRCIHRLRD